MRVPQYGIIFNHFRNPIMGHIVNIDEETHSALMKFGVDTVAKFPLRDVVFDCRGYDVKDVDAIYDKYVRLGSPTPIYDTGAVSCPHGDETFVFKYPIVALNTLHNPYTEHEIESIHYDTNQISLKEGYNITNTVDVKHVLFRYGNMSAIEISKFVSMFNLEEHRKPESEVKRIRPGIAKFHKISENMYKKVIRIRDWDTEFCSSYDELRKPQRMTDGSAGHDFFAPKNYTIMPGESVIIDTCMRCEIVPEWALWVLPKSGLGFKYQVMLANTIGLIDEDYFYTKNDEMSNEGHIMIKLVNEGRKILNIEKGQAFCQGVFLPYGITVDDNEYEKKPRLGGIGSTSKQTGDMSSNV